MFIDTAHSDTLQTDKQIERERERESFWTNAKLHYATLSFAIGFDL
jgi:hypothetical protein